MVNEPDPTVLDEKDPMPSRLVLCERESEVHESPTPGTSSPVVAADNAEHLGNRFTSERLQSPQSWPMFTRALHLSIRGDDWSCETGGR